MKVGHVAPNNWPLHGGEITLFLHFFFLFKIFSQTKTSFSYHFSSTTQTLPSLSSTGSSILTLKNQDGVTLEHLHHVSQLQGGGVIVLASGKATAERGSIILALGNPSNKLAKLWARENEPIQGRNYSQGWGPWPLRPTPRSFLKKKKKIYIYIYIYIYL